MGNCHFRLRGRTKLSYTLVSFTDANEAWEQLAGLKRSGARVQCLNYTSPRPNLPVKRGPTEWVANNFPAQLACSGSHAQQLRRLARRVAVGVPTRQQAMAIFDQWAGWAANRHFMVFKGHYKQWLDMFFENPGNCHLISMFTGDEIHGIFGWEDAGDSSQVTIAKHTPAMKGKELWIAGLLAVGPRRVLCGSTADDLKRQLGLEPVDSWTFDTSYLKGDGNAN